MSSRNQQVGPICRGKGVAGSHRHMLSDVLSEVVKVERVKRRGGSRRWLILDSLRHDQLSKAFGNVRRNDTVRW